MERPTNATVAVVSCLIVAALAVWLPLPFGSVLPWCHTVLGLAAFALLAVAALWAPHLGGLRRAAVPLAALAGVAALGALQSVSWPMALVRTVSPEHATTLASTLPTREVASAPLSLAPANSLAASLTWASAAACLALGVLLGYTRKCRRVLAFALLGSGVAQVLIGSWLLATRSTTLWGLGVPEGHRLRGTFVNPDHLAVYLEILLPVAFAWTWVMLRRARGVESGERRLAMLLPGPLVWVFLFVGLAFSGSRAGLVAALVGVVAQGALLTARARGWRWAWLGVLVPLAGVVAVGLLDIQRGFGRWLATSPYELGWNERLQLDAAAIRLAEHYPWLGTGLGTFRNAFPLVGPRDILGSCYFWHAHNDFLEVLLTTGIVGSVLVLAGLAMLLRRLLHDLRRRTRSEATAASLAALGALAAVAVHSCFDFGLTMPAVSATLALVCGLALAPAEEEKARPGSRSGGAQQRDRARQHGDAREPAQLEQVGPAVEAGVHDDAIG